MKTPLLFLCHRIPYPPNKGDKIRSFHLLHHLSQHFDIYLATFVDDPADWPYVPDVQKYCKDSLFVEQKKWLTRLRGATSLLTGEPLSVGFYRDTRMLEWVRKKVADVGIRRSMVFSAAMAQYSEEEIGSFERRVVDFVDVDSDKWAQYAQGKSWPLSWIYQREARSLLAYEKLLSHEFDASLFVSESEAALFKNLSPGSANKVGFYNNGVNTDYFFPAADRSSPYPEDALAVCFTGAMDYWPNIDAVTWFVQEVLPGLRDREPALQFYIVGSNPPKAVVQLDSHDGVVVTGRVEDVRPYIQHALAGVAPMRIARGVQNKVLEAMAMGKPVIVSTKGLEGISAENGKQVLIADDAADYIDTLCRVIAGDCQEIGTNAQAYVSENFNWDNNLPEVVLLLDSPTEPTNE